MKPKQLLAVLIIFSSQWVFGMELESSPSLVEFTKDKITKLQGPKVKLKITREEQIEIFLDIIKQSKTINTMLQDLETETPDIPIPLFNISTETLEILIPLLEQNYFLEAWLKIYYPKKHKQGYSDPFKGINTLPLDQSILLLNAIEQLDLKNASHPLGLSNQLAHQITAQIAKVEIDTSSSEQLNTFFTLLDDLKDTSRHISQNLIKQYEVDTLSQPYCEKLINTPIKSTAFSPDDILIYFTSDDTFKIYRNKSNNKLTIEKNGSKYFYIIPDQQDYFLLDTLQTNNAINKSCVIKTNKNSFIIFNGNNQQFILLSESQYTACGFGSNELIYLGDIIGALYALQLTNDLTQESEKKINLVTLPIRESSIQGITTDLQHDKIIFHTDKLLFLGKKTPNGITFKQISLPEKILNGNITQTCISPSGEFLYIRNSMEQLFIYNFLKKELSGRFYISPIGNAVQSWTQNSTLLISTDSSFQGHDTNNIPRYLFINPHSYNSWHVNLYTHSSDWTTLRPFSDLFSIPAISTDGTQAIELFNNYFIYQQRLHQETIFHGNKVTMLRNTIVDKNIQDTMQFFNFNYVKPTDQLKGIILLKYIKEKLPEASREQKPIILNPILEKIYSSLPQAVKTILSAAGTIQSTSWFSSLTLDNVRNKLYEYRKGLLGTAATALGLAAAYKYWTKGQK